MRRTSSVLAAVAVATAIGAGPASADPSVMRLVDLVVEEVERSFEIGPIGAPPGPPPLPSGVCVGFARNPSANTGTLLDAQAPTLSTNPVGVYQPLPQPGTPPTVDTGDPYARAC